LALNKSFFGLGLGEGRKSLKGDSFTQLTALPRSKRGVRSGDLNLIDQRSVDRAVLYKNLALAISKHQVKSRDIRIIEMNITVWRATDFKEFSDPSMGKKGLPFRIKTQVKGCGDCA
jgi:hypothetical protein